MINKITKTSLAAMALLGICAASHNVAAAEQVKAAQLVKLEGKVAVNSGDGFVPAKLGMVLKPGDQVLVGEKSAASLVYAQPGCVFEAAPASVVTVSEVGPCVPGQTVVQGKEALVTPTQASTRNGNYCYDSNDDDNRCLPFFLMGGAAVIGATAFIISEASDNNGGGDGNDGGPGGPGPSPN